jgi:hypothetical protein
MSQTSPVGAQWRVIRPPSRSWKMAPIRRVPKLACEGTVFRGVRRQRVRRHGDRQHHLCAREGHGRIRDVVSIEAAPRVEPVQDWAIGHLERRSARSSAAPWNRRKTASSARDGNSPPAWRGPPPPPGARRARIDAQNRHARRNPHLPGRFSFPEQQERRNTMSRADSVGGSDRASGGDLISSDRVEGTNVYDQAGNHLGSIESLMITKIEGKVAYAVLSFGGFLGLGAAHFPVPWSELSYSRDHNGYITSLTEADLTGAPTYASETEANWSDEDWRGSVDRHYGTRSPGLGEDVVTGTRGSG